MRIDDQFRVALPVEETWRLLLDVERIAPCMPGAELREIDGDEYRGVVKVKVGPITAQYQGAARITEADEAARRIVLDASGRDTRGQGNASAVVTIDLAADTGGTSVSIGTDLTITGKVAQFGRGMMAEVSSRLLKQFVANLERDVLSGGGAPSPPPAAERATAPAESTPLSADAPPADAPSPGASGAAPTGTPAPASADAPAAQGTEPATAPPAEGPRRVTGPSADPVDLLAVSGASVAKRVAPVVAGVVAMAVALKLLRRKAR